MSSSSSSLLSTAVVAGASRGIGKAIAKRLAKDGFQVYITYNSKEAEAQAVVQEILDAGGKAQAFQLNITNSEQIATFFTQHIKDKVLLSALVNNAGITKDTFLIRMSDNDFESVIDTNLKGSFCCLREAAKIMMKQRHGRIVFISSIIGQMGNAGQINYAASKAGTIGMVKSAAKELASRNITVNAVAPGFIDTDMTSSLPPEIKEQYLKSIPLGRLGSVDDVAASVSFLASNEAAYITGQVLAVNGGMYT